MVGGGGACTMLSDGRSTCTHLPGLSAHTHMWAHMASTWLKEEGGGGALWWWWGGLQVVLGPEFLPHEPSVGIPATHFLLLLQQLKLSRAVGPPGEVPS